MIGPKSKIPWHHLFTFVVVVAVFGLTAIYSTRSTAGWAEEPVVETSRAGFDIVKKQWDLTSMGNPPHLNCTALTSGDQVALKKYRMTGNVVFSEDPTLAMDCDSIKQRIQIRGHTQKKDNVAYAVARNVFLYYYTQETLLAINYSPQNSYCYAMANNTSPQFRQNMKQLETCLDNVKVIDEVFDFDSKGHFQDLAHVRCMQHLLTMPKWEYVLLLQNNDIILRTNSEISEILRAVNGTQLVGVDKPQWYRYHSKKLFTAKSLGLFKDESKKSDYQLNTNITVVKSLNQVFLSREFMIGLDHEVNLTRMTDEFNDPQYYGGDEMLFATLTFAAHLGLPGQTSKICYRRNDGPVRYQHWDFNGETINCRSPYRRHGICILTVDYLKDLSWYTEIIGNKVMASDDFGTVICMSEILQKRAKENKPFAGLDRYTKLNQVRQHQLKINGTFNPTKYTCQPE